MPPTMITAAAPALEGDTTDGAAAAASALVSMVAQEGMPQMTESQAMVHLLTSI